MNDHAPPPADPFDRSRDLVVVTLIAIAGSGIIATTVLTGVVQPWDRDWRQALGVLTTATLMLFIMVGLPLHAALRWSGRGGWLAYAMTGLGTGVGLAGLLEWMVAGPEATPRTLAGVSATAAAGAIVGAASALLFWMLAQRLRVIDRG